MKHRKDVLAAEGGPIGGGTGHVQRGEESAARGWIGGGFSLKSRRNWWECTPEWRVSASAEWPINLKAAQFLSGQVPADSLRRVMFRTLKRLQGGKEDVEATVLCNAMPTSIVFLE